MKDQIWEPLAPRHIPVSQHSKFIERRKERLREENEVYKQDKHVQDS